MSILRVRTEFVGVTGSPWLSNFYFNGAAPAPTQGEADSAVVASGAFWGAVDALITNTVSWSTLPDVAVLALTGEQTGVFATTPVTGTGGASDSALPFATQGLVRWLTGAFVGGRQVRGRTFIPGLTEAASNLGIPTSGTLTTIGTAAATLHAVASPILVVWSPTYDSSQDVTASSVWTKFAVLRSRRD